MKSDYPILGLTQAIRKQLNKTFGDSLAVSLVEDKEERTVEIADDIAMIFNENQEAKSLFDSMSYTHKKNISAGLKKPKNLRPEKTER